MKSSRSKLIDRICKLSKICSYDEFIKHLKQLKFKKLGEGATRIAYGNEKLVIKILKCIDSIDDNICEYITYKKFSKTKNIKWLVAPILKYFPTKSDEIVSLNFSIQAKEIPTKYRYRGKLFKQCEALDKIFIDAHFGNMMIIGKAVVMIDLNSEDGTYCVSKFNMSHFNKWKQQIDFASHKKAIKVAVNRALTC